MAGGGFANKWMDCQALRDMAEVRDMRLAHSVEVIIRSLSPPPQ